MQRWTKTPLAKFPYSLPYFLGREDPEIIMSALNDNPDLLSRPMRVGFMNTTRMAAPSSSGTKAERVRTFPCLISSRCDESADALTNGMDRSDATGSRGRPAHEARALETKIGYGCPTALPREASHFCFRKR